MMNMNQNDYFFNQNDESNWIFTTESHTSCRIHFGFN
jgi:hypothetical protein